MSPSGPSPVHNPLLSSPIGSESSISSPRPLNVLPMTTRAKDGIFKPRHPFVGLLHTEGPFVQAQASEPISTSEALSLPRWKNVMKDEFDALIRNKTWTLVPYIGKEK